MALSPTPISSALGSCFFWLLSLCFFVSLRLFHPRFFAPSSFHQTEVDPGVSSGKLLLLLRGVQTSGKMSLSPLPSLSVPDAHPCASPSECEIAGVCQSEQVEGRGFEVFPATPLKASGTRQEVQRKFLECAERQSRGSP